MFIGEVVQKQRVLLTSSERTVKKVKCLYRLRINCEKTEYLDSFRRQCESSKILHGDT